MGLIRSIKKKIIIGQMEKKKKANPFIIDYSDNYELPATAGNDINNSHYFSAHSMSGKECLFFRLAVRGGDAKDEVWLTYRDTDNNVYMAAADHISKSESLPARVECIEAGKTLRFYYNGTVKKAISKNDGYYPDEKAKPLNIILEAEFTGLTVPFEFSRHLSSEPMGRTLSQEKWTKAFLASLKEHHQVHYEQAGLVTATIILDGKKTLLEKIPTFRDHSYGKRDWDYFDRHLWLVGILENGDFIHTSLIRYPLLNQITAGFYQWDDKTKSILSATKMDSIPTIGKVPDKFEFDATYIDGQTKHIKCKLDFACPYSFGSGQYTIYEGVSSFEVDGIKGRGITEFGFNKNKSRWFRGK